MAVRSGCANRRRGGELQLIFLDGRFEPFRIDPTIDRFAIIYDAVIVSTTLAVHIFLQIVALRCRHGLAGLGRLYRVEVEGVLKPHG